MSKKITDNQFIYYFQENCTENLALQIDYSIKEIGFISIFKSAYIKHKGKVPTEKLLKFCPIFDIKDAVEFHAFICKFCEIKRGFFVQEKFDKVVNEIIEKSNKSKSSIKARWNKSKALNGYTNVSTNVSTNDYTKDKVKDKVKVKDIIINNNIDQSFEEFWNKYNHKKSKPKAIIAYKKALKNDNHDNIMLGVDNYIKNRGVESTYWKHPTTWLNSESWKDEYQTKANNHNNFNKQDYDKGTEGFIVA